MNGVKKKADQTGRALTRDRTIGPVLSCTWTKTLCGLITRIGVQPIVYIVPEVKDAIVHVDNNMIDVMAHVLVLSYS